MKAETADQKDTLADDFAHLARLSLTTGPHDVQLFVRRMTRRYRESLPQLSEQLLELLRQSPTRMSPLRKEGVASVPVDTDSRLELLRIESVPTLDVEPVFPPSVEQDLAVLVRERRERDQLDAVGLEPTRTVLFTGEPGVGKSLAARWLAREIGVPLLVLDLSAVMSSFLGRTGNNVRQVMEYAKGLDCVLLLDELDAIAKRRDDATEVGELKRLVTVLLQEIDNWPSGGLIVAATNHPKLLDPAVWRRFERRVEFPLPDESTLAIAIGRFLGGDEPLAAGWKAALASSLRGASFSDVERLVVGARRAAAVNQTSLADEISRVLRARVSELPKGDRSELAARLVSAGLVSQREAYDLTGVSRDTIRKVVRSGGGSGRED